MNLTGKNHPELDNLDSERQILCTFTYICILVLKSMIRKLQSKKQQSSIAYGTRNYNKGKYN